MGSGLLGPQKTSSLALKGHVGAQGVLSTNLDSDPAVAANLDCPHPATLPHRRLDAAPGRGFTCTTHLSQALHWRLEIRGGPVAPALREPQSRGRKDISNTEDYDIVDRSICTEADVTEDLGT